MNTPINQLKSIFENTITTLSIAEPLNIQSSETYKDYSNSHNYDTVVYKNQDDDTLFCYDRFTSNEPSLIKHSDIVTDSTPLIEVVRLLVKKRRLFVHERNSIKYIVTISDLEKMPVRIWLFGIISITEMQLKNLIQSKHPNDSFVNYLTPGRIEFAKALFKEKVKSNSEIKLIDCIQFCDIESIIKKSNEILRSFSRAYKKSEFDILSDAQKLRDMLAHAQKIEMEWENILKVTELLESLLNDLPK